ncbi:MAG TPA: glycosyl hydrolase 53 family protein [Verrucomicrobiae bacterium]|nr:glycosyl hydrolase 53 family protein [Verrucomicrobiae bacterium]
MPLPSPKLATTILLLLVPLCLASASNFVPGADMSLLAFFESKGKVYKESGVTTDALVIIRQSGVTCVRLRLFTSSAAQAAADPYDYINNTNYTIPLAQRVKNAGLQLCLDFHYSDTWADPSHQAIPSAWTNLSYSALVQQMFTYNSNTIAAFRAAGAMPDYVQLGNEITSGMLWPYGMVGSPSNNWSQLGQLMNAAIQGIQAASAGTSTPKIIVHISTGGNWSTTEWFFDNLNAQSVPLDIIGLSYYPFWDGPFANLSNCLNNAANRYHKPVSVMETAFPWNNSYWTTNFNGIFPSETGQVQYVEELAPIVSGVTGGYGAGAFWWGTEYQAVSGVNEAGFNTASWFDSGGNVLPAAAEYGQLLNTNQLGVTPSSVVFGTVATGRTVQASFVVTNTGGSLLTGSATVAPPFGIVMGNSFSLSSGSSTNVVVSFTPPAAGGYSTNVIFASTANSSTNLVSGTGVVAPVASFTASPTNGVAPLSVNFTDTSSGSPTGWAWAFGDGNESASRNPSDVYVTPGSYAVQEIVSGTGGSSTSTVANLISVYSPFAWWQLNYFGSTNSYGNTAPTADYTGTGMSNTNKFLAGFNPTSPAAYLHIISVVPTNGTNIVVTYLGACGDTNWSPGIQSRTNVLDFTTGDASGNYTNGGWQDTGQTNILSGGNGSGTVTNMTDTAIPSGPANRYYRVRVLLP